MPAIPVATRIADAGSGTETVVTAADTSLGTSSNAHTKGETRNRPARHVSSRRLKLFSSEQKHGRSDKLEVSKIGTGEAWHISYLPVPV